MLSHLRVLDLTDGEATIAGRLLADLGADVVLVEPPGGIGLRRQGPFAHDQPGPETSLSFWATNRGKSSVVVDLETPEGRRALLELAADADVLIESGPPGALDVAGVGPAALAEAHPALVVVSITPFGLDGPKAGWSAHDLTVQAASGAMALTGHPDRAPLQLSSAPQAFLHAGIEAVVATLVALAGRGEDGWGRHVDVSAQTSTMLCAQQCVLSELWGDRPVQRSGGAVSQGGVAHRIIYPAADGWVSITLLFGSTFGEFSRRLVELVCADGLLPPSAVDVDYHTFGVELREGRRPLADLEELTDAVERWTRRRTCAELAALAASHRLLAVAVSAVADVRASPQLEARRFFTPVDHPDLGRPVTYPGPFARFGSAPLQIDRPPPPLAATPCPGASALPRRIPPTVPARAAAQRAHPLEGLKVLDFTWVMAGPMTVRYLTDAGATVVHIESATRPDSLRAITPFAGGRADPDTSGIHANLNCDKLALSLDLSVAEARDVVLRLVDWADVVVENYSPKAMRNWGLDYESLRRHRPDVIMASSCLNGQTGPEADFAGYGTMGAQMAGFGALAGWPDRAPVGPFGAYTDYCAPRFSAMALLAALEHRRRTGEGQHIDLSQTEASLHLLGPAFLDLEVNGRIAERRGNTSPDVAPHGVYPCAGHDRWVAVVAANDAQFAALGVAIGRVDWAADPALATAADRVRAHERLDADVAAWTCTRTADEVEDTLQAAGVPVHRVLGPADVTTDPQLIARRHFVEVDHPVLGRAWVENSRLRLSGADTTPRRGGLRIGEHNEAVLSMLGLDSDEQEQLRCCGALR
ncbi:MAG: CaiB/BaiF CoA transferase family protein [Acidimicrobiales bacterium]